MDTKFGLKITFVEKAPKTELTVVGAFAKGVLGEVASNLDKSSNGALAKAIALARFEGKAEKFLRLPSLFGVDGQVILAGLGDIEAATPLDFEKIGAGLFSSLDSLREKKAVIDFSDIAKTEKLTPARAIAHVASGALLRSFKFDKYKTKRVPDEIPVLEELVFATPDVKESSRLFDELAAIAEGNRLTRFVVTDTPNVIYPESVADIALSLADLGLKVEVLGQKEMEKLGFGALLGVAQGSVREPKLITLQWNGGAEDQKPVAFVGKGVTFDTGGISIKPSNGMEDMKYDMAGSGVVLGLMKSLALRRAKVNAVGVMGMVENMPSGSAQRPSDVVVSLSGQTIEVLNTDAEGRLVLADALWYTQDRFKPRYMIDLATLTGAVTVALGYEYAGLLGNDDELCEMLTEAGAAVGEPMWRLPLDKAYDKDIDSDIADVKNIGSGRGAGTITAAQFLARFVNETPWAHLDIAGMAWDKRGKPLSGKGATGYGVRLLNKFLRDNFEK